MISPLRSQQFCASAQNCRLKNKPSGLFFNLYPPFSRPRRRPFTAAPRATPAARAASIKALERARRCFCRSLCLTRSFTSATRVSLLYTLRAPPLPKRRGCQNAKRARPAHGMTVDAARPLKRRYESQIVRRKKGQTYAAVCLSVCLIKGDKSRLSRLILQISIFSTCISAANSAAVLGGGSMAAFLLYRKKRGNTITHFDP